MGTVGRTKEDAAPGCRGARLRGDRGYVSDVPLPVILTVGVLIVMVAVLAIRLASGSSADESKPPVLVLGDSIIKHIVNGDTVMVYRKPEMGGGSANNMKPGVKVDGTPITSGSISLQAETAEIDFRKVEVLNLEGCTDPKAANYKRYFVKSDPAACRSR